MAKKPLIIDTGFFVALANRRDRYHERALQIGARYEDYDWITSWPVITEMTHILPPGATLKLLRAHRSGLFRIGTLEETDLSHIADLLERYREHHIDLADISLVILAERLKCGDILTCDQRDFSILRWGKTRPFNNRFLP